MKPVDVGEFGREHVGDRPSWDAGAEGVLDFWSFVAAAGHDEWATFGHSTSGNWRKTFFQGHPETECTVVVHHAVGITSYAEGARGAIRVSVNSAGVVTNLGLGEDVRTMRSRRLAQTIMETIRKAQAQLGSQVAQLMEERVGEDTRSISVVSEQYARQFPPVDDAETGRAKVPLDDDYPADDVLRPVRESRGTGW